MVVTLAAGFIKRTRKNRALRKPTRDQIDDFATPAGALAARHLPMHKLGPDILDMTEAGAAIGAWLMDGPILEMTGPDIVHLGVPEPDEEYEPEVTDEPVRVEYLP